MAIEDETRAVRQGSLGWMIQRLAGRLNREMARRLSEHDLTHQQFAVLMTALETPGLSQTEIGARFEMPPYAISRAIDHLAEAGLLERRPHPTSRRAHVIYATPRGEGLSTALFDIVHQVNDDLASPLTPTERQTFRALLERILGADTP